MEIKTFKNLLKEDFKKILKENKGQVDLIGNFFTLLEQQPWILAIIFLAAVYATTFSLEVAGVKIDLVGPLNLVLGSVAGAFGFGFDWRLIVIIIFLSIPTGFVIKYGW